MPGLTGQLYKQFALTIAFSVGLSGLNALTLSPALCAVLLRPGVKKKGWFFRGFNKGFAALGRFHDKGMHLAIRRWPITLILFAGVIVAAYWLIKTVPTGFVPDEDQGYFFILQEGPEGMALARTEKISSQVEKIIKEVPGVKDVLLIGGYNIIAQIQDTRASTIIVILNPWHERTTKALSLEGIMMTTYQAVAHMNEVNFMPFGPPPIQGLGTAGGFQYQLEDYLVGELQDLYILTL